MNSPKTDSNISCMQVHLQNLCIFTKTENSIAQLQQEKRNPSPLLCHKHGDIKFLMDEYTGNNFFCSNSLSGEICYLLQAIFQPWQAERWEVSMGSKTKAICLLVAQQLWIFTSELMINPNPLWQDESQCCLSFEEDVMRKQDTKHQNQSVFCRWGWGVTLK